MPAISEDSFFFISVDSVCRRPAVTCSLELGLVEMAGIMKRDNISGIVVVDGEKPIGVVSLRDLRDLIASGTSDFSNLIVRDIMKSGLITIRSSDYLFKAIFLMAKHNIHRLVVVDERDQLVGVMTDTDLFRIQTRSPLYLIQEIESATTIEQLVLLGQKMTGMLQYAVKTNADIQSLIQLIAHFNDAMTRRLIFILDCREDIRLPAGAAFLVLGSEGREEQTLRTDQDSAIVYRDDLSAAELAEVSRFADRIAPALESLGVPLCPGNMMASNPDWCHSLSAWKHLTERWITMPSPDHTVFFGVFQDLRVLHGDTAFEKELQAHLCECTRANAVFFPNMARTISSFKVPLGIFGRFLIEKKGEHSGKLDLKKGGLFALTRGISLLALEAGIAGGTSWDKLERLKHLNLVSPSDLETIRESFTFLMKMRLERQLRSVSYGKEPSNCVDPQVLSEKEQNKLRKALKGANTMISLLRNRYQLDLTSG
ncbi:MAG: CBS domain-containing protein [Deltaproteobacteria bacterium]|nr:CBS domain-containing protein [Deltaproteobacteria bacterium]